MDNYMKSGPCGACKEKMAMVWVWMSGHDEVDGGEWERESAFLMEQQSKVMGK